MTNARFPRLTPEALNPAQRDVAAEIAAGPRGEMRGPFLALIHNAELARGIQRLGEHLRFHNKLPLATLEIAVLVTARKWNCQYEFFMHDRIARKAGLAAGIIDAIAQGKEPAGMSADEALVYKASRQAHESGRLDDETFAAARERFGLDGTLDLLALNGYYSMMAMVLNTAGMPLPDNAQPPLGKL